LHAVLIFSYSEAHESDMFFLHFVFLVI